MKTSTGIVIALACTLFCGCSDDAGGPTDSGVTDSGAGDTGAGDAGSDDGGPADSSTGDSAASDGGPADSGADDAGSGDSGSSDAGSSDAGSSDAGSSDAGGGGCAPAVDASNPLYDRYEGTVASNSCSQSRDCIASGCSGEVCAAEAVASTCEVVPAPGGTCQCSAGSCIWATGICE